jgi:5'-nucleotidase
MRELGEVSVLAPDRNWSGSGHVKTINRPLRVREVTLADDTKAYTCDGAPSDCVALGLLGFIPGKIDLVVSGINPMANLGHDVTYSGTVTAAMEAVIWGVPAVAFSLDSPENHLGFQDYCAAAQAAQIVAQKVLERRLPPSILLNVNVPLLPWEDIKGFSITRQGMRVYRDRLEERTDPRGNPYYWIGGDAPTGIPEQGTDIGALAGEYISITPLQMDLTAYLAQQVLHNWQWDDVQELIVA